MSDSPERTFPASGYVFAVILAGVLVLLLGSSAGLDQALLLAVVLIGWAVASAAIFGRQDAEGH